MRAASRPAPAVAAAVLQAGGDVGRLQPDRGQGRHHPLLERRQDGDAEVGAPFQADHGRHERRGAGPGHVDHRVGHPFRRGLGHEEDGVGAGVVAEGGHGQLGHAPVDGVVQVAPAQADDVGDGGPPPVEQAHRLLGAGAGRGHHAHPGPTVAAIAVAVARGLHRVGEPESRPPEHGRARARAHHQPAEVGGPVLELDLVGHRHVVAEEQDVQARGQRLVGLQGGVVAGHRHQGHVRPRLQVDRLPDGAHRSPGGAGRPARRTRLGRKQHVLAGGDGLVGDGVVGRPHGHEQVVGRRPVEGAPVEALTDQGVDVGRGGHGRGRPVDPLHLAQGPGAAHLQHRVEVGAGVDLHPVDHLPAATNGRIRTMRVPVIPSSSDTVPSREA